MEIITQQQDVAYKKWNDEVENENCLLPFEQWYVYYCFEKCLYDDR